MGINWSLSCPRCGSELDASRVRSMCPKCNEPLLFEPDLSELQGALSPEELAARPTGVWRYRELLPVSGNPITLGEGGTRLHRCVRLGGEIGIQGLLVKDETKNPTGCFLDRGSTVLVSRIVQEGYRGIVGTLKGNLGASLSAYAARAGIGSLIRLDGPTDPAKLYQMIAYGAEVVPPDGELRKPEGYYEVLNSDPLLVEGEKTLAIEIAESLGWKEPDVLIVPVGSGSLLTAVWKGFSELREIGLTSGGKTRIYGVQPHIDSSVALDLHFPKPDRKFQAERAASETGGRILTASDDEIIEASRRLARTEGIFAEPAAASTLAAAERLRLEGEISPGDVVVLVVTGSGLKDPSAAVKELERLHLIDAYLRGEVSGRPIGRTKAMILKLLAEKSMHGYEIWRRLRAAGLDLSLPAIYQHLKALEEMGAVARVQSISESGRTRVVYSLTSRGRLLLAAGE